MDIYDIGQNNDFSGGKQSEKKQKILTDSQKKLIMNRWLDESLSPPSIKELIVLAFPNHSGDSRTVEAMLIKDFLVEKEIKLETEQVNNKNKGDFLTDEQKKYITANCSELKAAEMARFLFPNEKIATGGRQIREINLFLRSLDPKILYSGEIPEDDYRPPNTLERVIVRIKKYVDECKTWDYKKLTPRQKKYGETLMGYLHSFRFKLQIDNYENPNDKILFESTFIKYCYDKDDLTQENTDQYILLCADIVMMNNIQRNIDTLNAEQDRILNEDGKLSMTIVDAIKNTREEYNQCIKRQQALYKSLVQERSEKLSEEIKDKATLLNLFNAWKNYESRQKILKLREAQKNNLRKELYEIENMDEMKQRVLGISIDQIIDG